MKNKVMSLVIVIIIVSFSVHLVAATTNGTGKVETEIDAIDSKKKDAEKALSDSEKKAKELTEEKDKKTKEKQTLEKESEDIDEEIEKIGKKVTTAEENYKKQENLCKKRIAVMYQNSNNPQVSTFLRLKTLFEFYQKTYIMSLVTKKDKELMKNLSLAKKEVEASKKLQQDLLKDKQDKVDEAEKDIKEIVTQGNDVKKDIDKKKKTVQNYVKMLEEMEKESKNVENYITGNTQSSSGSTTKYTGGKMKWPVPSSSAISSPFGYRINPISGTSELHTGLDIPAVTGSSIIAPANGTVIYSGWQNGYGYTLMIDYGNSTVTLFGHCSSLNASNGQKVVAGQVVAKVGTTGYSTGPHLHFEVRNAGKPIDPMGYVTP